MILLAAIFLAQVTSASPQPAMTPQPAMSPAPVATEGPILRRPPPQAFVVPPDAALIVNSGSTNFAGFKIAVERDGTATIMGTVPRIIYQQPSESDVTQGRVSAATAKWLFERLASDRPLDKLAGGQCARSVSFGSTTTIAWNGETTPDIGCPGDARVAELNRTVNVIEKQLGIMAWPRHRRYLQ
jgi:hypothetical protein